MDWPNGEPCSIRPGFSGHSLTATGATSAEQRTWVTSGLDRRQLDALVDLFAGPATRRGTRLAFRAGRSAGIDHAVRFGCSARPNRGGFLPRWALAAGLRTVRLSAPETASCAKSARISPVLLVELSLVRSGGWDTLRTPDSGVTMSGVF